MFFKRKKLIEINEKIEQLVQIVENQSDAFEKIENRLSLLEQKELRSAESINHVLETMIDLNKDSKQYVCDFLAEKDEQVSLKNEYEIKNLTNVLQEYEKNSISSLENIIAEIKKIQASHQDNAKETKELLNIIKELMDINAKMKNSIDGKLEVIENEVRLLLVNSVMEQIPEE